MTWRAISIIPLAGEPADCHCQHACGNAHAARFSAGWAHDNGNTYARPVCLNRASAIAQEFQLKPWPLGPGDEVSQ